MEQKNPLITYSFAILLLFVLYQVTLILWPFYITLFWSAIIAFAFHPAYRRLADRMGGRRTAAALLVTVVILLACAPLASLFLFSLVSESLRSYAWISEKITGGSLKSTFDWFDALPIVNRLESFIGFDLTRDHIKRWMLQAAGSAANYAAAHAATLTRDVLSGIFNFFLTFFLVFFMLRDGTGIRRFVYDLTPLGSDTKEQIFTMLEETFAAVLRGQILTALAQSLVAGLIFWALGLPLPVLFATVMFFTSMIPVLGATSVWLPFVVYLVLQGAMVKAGILLVLGVFVISFIDNLLKPWLIGDKTKLPYLLLFLGILGGLQLYGIVGIFIAPAVLSLFFTLIKIYREQFLTSR
ncbi:MAG: putative transport protein YdiK [Candidatus Omnitrophica bacterium]|nr:putative transport protein YdiK [Candidatus Omnitrophota bacterium]